MKRYFITFSLFLICHSPVYAQDSLASILGRVEVIKDSTGLFFSPPNEQWQNQYILPGATVSLLYADSTISKGVSTNMDGIFKFHNIKRGNYILQAKHLGYEDAYSPIFLKTGEKLDTVIYLGKIYPEAELPFGAEEAKSDLKKGIVEIKEFSIVTLWEFEGQKEAYKKAAAEAQQKFGFTIKDITDEYEHYNWHKVNQAVIRYNQVVNTYLSRIHGAKWKGNHYKTIKYLQSKTH